MSQRSFRGLVCVGVTVSKPNLAPLVGRHEDASREHSLRHVRKSLPGIGNQCHDGDLICELRKRMSILKEG